MTSQAKALLVAGIAAIVFLVCAVIAFEKAAGPIIGMAISGAVAVAAGWYAGVGKVKELDHLRRLDRGYALVSTPCLLATALAAFFLLLAALAPEAFSALLCP